LKKNGILIIAAPNMLSPFRNIRLLFNNLILRRFHPDGTLRNLFYSVVQCTKKFFTKDISFSYRQPSLNFNKWLGSDYDAIFLVNPIDLKKFSLKKKLKLLNLSDSNTKFGRVVEYIIPLLAGGIFFVAKKI